MPGRVVRNICPASPGAKDWNPSAFSPVTGLIYIPHLNLCMDMGVTQRQLYSRHAVRRRRREDVRRSRRQPRRVHRLGPGRPARKVFEIKEDLPLWSPALATAGGLVFYGTMDGWFKAIDARTGKLLWQFKTGSGIIGQPISYRGPDGRQYIAVPSGVGGWAGAIVSAEPRSARPDRGARLQQCREGPAEARFGGRNGLCLRASEIGSPSPPRSRCLPAATEMSRDSAASRSPKPFRRSARAPTRSSPATPSPRHSTRGSRPMRRNAFAIAQGQQLYTADELRRLPLATAVAAWARR